MSDYEQAFDLECPKCGHSPVHYRSCSELSCNDGFIDENDDDPINFMPGESEYPCPECRGTSVEQWCPKCGENLSGQYFDNDELPEYDGEIPEEEPTEEELPEEDANQLKLEI